MRTLAEAGLVRVPNVVLRMVPGVRRPRGLRHPGKVIRTGLRRLQIAAVRDSDK